MQNKDKILREVATKLGIPHTKVREVVSSQAGLVRKAIRNKETTSVYLRKVGTFISPSAKQYMNNQTHKNLVTKLKAKEIEVISPIHF